MKKKPIKIKLSLPKEKIAWAIIDKKRPIIRVNDVFETNDVEIASNERIIKILIKPYDKVSK